MQITLLSTPPDGLGDRLERAIAHAIEPRAYSSLTAEQREELASWR